MVPRGSEFSNSSPDIITLSVNDCICYQAFPPQGSLYYNYEIQDFYLELNFIGSFRFIIKFKYSNNTVR